MSTQKLSIIRVGQPPPYTPEKRCVLWHVHDFSAAKGEPSHLFGPATYKQCQDFVSQRGVQP